MQKALHIRPTIVHSTMSLTCACDVRLHLNRKTGRQTVQPVDYPVFGAATQISDIGRLKRANRLLCAANRSSDVIDQLPKLLMMLITDKDSHVECRLDNGLTLHVCK